MYLLPMLLCLSAMTAAESDADRRFEQLAARYVDELPGLSPAGATLMGDHRFDAKLDQVGSAAIAKKTAFCRSYLDGLAHIDRAKLSRANQIDYAMLEHKLHAQVWKLGELEEWAWNPLIYTNLAGSSIYGLLARDFAPLRERLAHVADRLEQFPRLLDQVRSTLDARRVPKIHAETAIKQNGGVLNILENMVQPHLVQLPADERNRLGQAMAMARAAVQKQQKWLESELLPNAAGEFRIGAERFDQKLAFTLQSPITRQELRRRAETQLRDVRERMYDISKEIYRKQYPLTRFPAEPSEVYRQSIIRACLELACQKLPEPDKLVEMAEESLALATAFVRKKDLVTVPNDPLEIIVMPEFERGVSFAYCDSPGPLDVGQKTFYAVSPPPADWTAEQVRSFLREYNALSLHNLTIHEAMPGHFLQLAHANRYPGRLRSLLSSGVFIEGWAVYSEWMMCEEGFLEDDPLMRLTVLKWYLRDTTNALIDQQIHAENMTREEAMQLLVEGAFQEEREAAGKWVRAQLTSTQLSTYFVGYLGITDLRRETEEAWGEKFDLKTFHDRLLSYGSPPVRYVRAMLLDEEIPR